MSRNVVRVKRGAAATRRMWAGLLLAAGLAAAFGLAGCSKKQPVKTDPTVTQPAAPPAPVQVPKNDIPVVDERPKAEEVRPADLGLKPVFFDFDKDDLSEEARGTLAQNGRIMKEMAGVRVMIEGHCDERGTVQYNLALGEKRARSAKQYLADLGVDAGHLDVVSYGKSRPFAPGHDEASWAQNRRAQFVPQGTGH